MELTGHPYPASLRVDTPEHMARWRPLVQWLLAIPHWFVLYALGILSRALMIISWFVVLITGRLPAGLANMQVMYLRYADRTLAYAGFLVDDYPPFAFDTEGDDPGTHHGVLIDVEPALEHRNRLTTLLRLILAIPHLIVLSIVQLVAFVLWVVGGLAVLVTGAWPSGLQHFVVGSMRWALRLDAYMLLLTDEYPPFGLD
jgi:hypothetical protein